MAKISVDVMKVRGKRFIHWTQRHTANFGFCFSVRGKSINKAIQRSCCCLQVSDARMRGFSLRRLLHCNPHCKRLKAKDFPRWALTQATSTSTCWLALCPKLAKRTLCSRALAHNVMYDVSVDKSSIYCEKTLSVANIFTKFVIS